LKGASGSPGKSRKVVYRGNKRFPLVERGEIVEQQGFDLDNHEYAIDIRIEVADRALFLDRLGVHLAGVKKGLVVEELLKGVGGVHFRKEQGWITKTGSRTIEGVAFIEDGCVGIGLEAWGTTLSCLGVT
jgi:hypothetical protein